MLKITKAKSLSPYKSYKTYKKLYNSKYNSKPRTPLRKMSITKTNQDEEGSCFSHAMTKLIVKNVFEKVYPLEMSLKHEKLYEKNNCNLYLNTNTKKTNSIGELTPINCGQNGYYKIILFLYVYYIIRDKYGCDGGITYLSASYFLNLFKGKSDGSKNNNSISILMPKIFQQSIHLPILSYLLKKIKSKINNIKYEIVDINANAITTDDTIIIRKLLDSGLYVAISLKPRYGDEHTTTIVGHTPYHFVIKNSWDTYKDYIPYKYLNDYFKLGIKSYKITQYHLILPIYKNMKRYDYALEENEDLNIYTIYLEIEKSEIEEYKKWIFYYVEELSQNKLR